MSERRYRVLVVSSHPVQYAVPQYRRMAVHPKVDLLVAFCSLQGANPGYDPGFGREVAWDIPLLDGYRWVELKNHSLRPRLEHFFGLINFGLWRLLRQGRFDAVVLYTGYRYASFWIAYLAAKLSGTAVLFGTDAATLGPRDGRAWKVWLKRLLWPRLFRLADMVIAPSAAGFKLMQSLGLPDERITLTPFTADNDWWTHRAAQADRSVVRNGWGVPDGDLVILFSAKLQPWKRPQDALQAFSRANIPHSVLVFAGDGDLRSVLQQEAKELGVAERVRFLGFINQSELPATYAAADLFVLPSDYDPCPVVVCEAMLCGLPVVLSDQIPGRFDLVHSRVTGEIFRCGDVASLANAFASLLGDPARLAELSRNARERMGTWSPRESVAATVEAIERAVRHGAS